jgi:beta-alanine degradation protein BauB
MLRNLSWKQLKAFWEGDMYSEGAATSVKDPEVWPQWLQDEFKRNEQNGCVGTRLISESERVRVWEVRLKPGERIGFHRHVLDYFWTAVTPGRGRSYQDDGTVMEITYQIGDTRHSKYESGKYKVHDLENIGDTELIFNTVEFLDSANAPLAVPKDARTT